MNKPWQLILDDKASGYLNMAKDEAMLSLYIKERVPTLRIYGWDKPFITIGYNQDPKKVIKASSLLSYVRRITGGASIIHDQEITYSLVCSKDDLALPNKVKESYKVLTSFLLEFYSRLGLKANFACDDLCLQSLRGYSRSNLKSSGIASGEPVPSIARDTLAMTPYNLQNFCFSSYEPYDIIINGKKIGGNAQRRKKDIIFQHGSIPQYLDFSFIEANINDTKDLSAKATYLEALLNAKTDYSTLQDLLVDSFKNVFAINFCGNNLIEI